MTTRSILALSVALALPAVAGAASFTVNSTADAVDATPGNGTCATAAGACTLRAAVQEANALAGVDSVSVPAGTYFLSLTGGGEDAAATGDLDVTEGLEVVGAGSGETFIDGVNADGVFQIVAAVPFTLRAATIRNGFGAVGAGGGVMHIGGAALSIDGARFERNTAPAGAAVYHAAGQLNVTNTAFVENVAQSAAGGVFHGGEAMTITGCEFADNSAPGSAGAIYATGTGNVTITDSTFERHTSVSGGCIFAGLTGSMTVSGSRFTSCSAGAGTGGGMYVALGSGSLTVTGSTFEGGIGIIGAGIMVATDMDVTVSDSTFTDNVGGSGAGAIYATASGPIALTGSRFERNGASTGTGGALFLATTGAVTLTDVTVADSDGQLGAGAVVSGGSLALTRTVVARSTSSAGPGGGMYATIGGAASLTDSEFADNVSGATSGGGLYLAAAGAVTVQGSTFAGNRAYGPSALGGGLLVSGSGVTIGNSTFSDNRAGSQGGALYAGAPTTIASSTFVGNAAADTGASIYNSVTVTIQGSVLGTPIFGDGCGGAAVTSNGDNVDQDGGCALAGLRDRASLDPQLEALADNGGPTRTHQPTPTSPLVDANGGVCPAKDQRGIDRPTDGNGDGVAGCDVGSVEFVDECPQDPAKVLPGICGCGVADVDANGNGPLDCLLNAELKVRIAAAKTNMSAITGKKGADQKALKATVKAGADELVAYVETNRPGITLADPAADLSALAGSAHKAIRKTLKGKGKALKKKQTKAAAALDALDAAVAPQ